MVSRHIIWLAFLVIQGTSATLRSEWGEAEPRCSHPGLNTHPTDCHKFMVCSEESGRGYVAKHYSCPPGEAFSTVKKTCVPEEEIPECFTAATVNVEDCHDSSISCVDCSTLVICKEIGGVHTPIEYINCSNWCDSTINSCTDYMPKECYPHAECTGTGFFPDPGNCTIYYRCYEEGETLHSEVNICPQNQVYHTNVIGGGGSCVPRRKPSDCITVKCPGYEVVTIPYPMDPRFYVVCVFHELPFVYRCEDGLHFDPDHNRCVGGEYTTYRTHVLN